ncbi:MAG: collagen binding domain-containing protein [Planctomycetota bacterium]
MSRSARILAIVVAILLAVGGTLVFLDRPDERPDAGADPAESGAPSSAASPRSSDARAGGEADSRESLPIVGAADSGAAPAGSEPRVVEGAGDVIGKVVFDDDLSPVADTLVVLGTLADVGGLGTGPSTSTDANGEFRFRAVELDGVTVVSAMGVSESVRRVLGAAAPVVLRVPRSVALVGEVRDSRDTPVRGAEVLVSHGLDTTNFVLTTRTNESGRFTVHRARDQRGWVRVRAKGYRDSDAFLLDPIPARQDTIRIVLTDDPMRLVGRVIDTAGSGVAGAIVVAGPQLGAKQDSDATGRPRRVGDSITARSDAEGRFVIDGLAPGNLNVSARARGVGYVEQEIGESARRSAEIELRLQPFATLYGTVAATGGVADESLSIAIEPWPRSLRTQWVVVDETGAYEMRDLAPGTFRLEVWRKQSAVHALEVTVPPGERRRLDLTVEAAASLAGRVVDTAGLPLPGYSVVAIRDGKWLASTTTDDSGAFAISGVSPGPVTIRAGRNPEGSSARSHLLNAAELATAAPATDLELVVKSASGPLASLRARVVTAAGQPLPGAILYLSARGAGSIQFPTDSEGVIATDELVPGEYHLQVRHPAHATLFPGSKEFTAGVPTDLGELRMPASGRLSARARAIDAVDLGALDLRVLDGSGREVGKLLLEGDRYVSGPLPAGPATLTISGPSIARATHPITVPNGSESTIDLVVQRGLTTWIDASLPPNAPSPAWVWCSIYDAEQRLLGGQALERGEDGAYHAALAFAPGRYVVVVGTDKNTLRGQVEIDVASENGRYAVVLGR